MCEGVETAIWLWRNKISNKSENLKKSINLFIVSHWMFNGFGYWGSSNKGCACIIHAFMLTRSLRTISTCNFEFSKEKRSPLWRQKFPAIYCHKPEWRLLLLLLQLHSKERRALSERENVDAVLCSIVAGAKVVGVVCRSSVSRTRIRVN